MPHHCHARGCKVDVPPARFMCRRHWMTLPKPMRDAIWATYEPGQEVTKVPSPSYLQNARAAIEWLAEREGEGGGEVLPALTLWQPWASLIAIGAKPWEFRSWPAPKRLWGKRMAIHAGVRPVRTAEVLDLLARLSSAGGGWSTALKPDVAIPFLEQVASDPKRLPLSAVICTAQLGVPIRDLELAAVLGSSGPLNDSDRDGHTNYGWPMLNVEVFATPLPARGARGLWPWTAPKDRA